MPRKKRTAQRPAGTKINKSAWIRSQPATMAGKDVLAKATADGIKLSLAQIYTARSNAKKKSVTKAKPGPTPKKVASSLSTQERFHDQHFISLVLDMGLSAAEALLERVRDRVRAL
jgi:hypothetical protein